jgi:hypothetical protein
MKHTNRLYSTEALFLLNTWALGMAQGKDARGARKKISAQSLEQ